MNKCKINQLTLEGELIQEHESTKVAARSVQGEGAAISHAAMKNKPYKGFLWQYAEPKPIRRPKIEVLEEMNLQLIEDLENRIDELEDYYITSKIRQIQYNNDTINEILMQEQPIEKKKGHGRPPISIDMYNKDNQFIKRFESIKQASEETKDPVDKIRATLNGKLSLTPHGYYFKKVDETNKKDKRDKNENDDETAAEYLDFYIPRNREDKKKLLYNYVTTRLENYYFQLTKKEAIMHKQFLTKLIKSL